MVSINDLLGEIHHARRIDVSDKLRHHFDSMENILRSDLTIDANRRKFFQEIKNISPVFKTYPTYQLYEPALKAIQATPHVRLESLYQLPNDFLSRDRYGQITEV